MELSSPAFTNNGPIPKEYSCQGDGKSPELHWSDLPTGTEELALIVDDPDASSGTFVHWVIYGLNSGKGGLGVNEIPAGSKQGANSAGKNSYAGPCPPAGNPHHYHFKLYALSTKLNADEGLSADELEKEISGKVLAQAELVGTYKRV
jgi:Raf kinase inhibitor-like YbhB/YbcL family protein